LKYGAIDIGTNAARLLVGELTVENGHTFIKKVSYTRIPLRLGEEVFENGKISKAKATNFVKTIKAFRLISEIFDVKQLRACATSAMREAENGEAIQQQILEETGVHIEIISGDEEASLIFGTFALLETDLELPYIVIDVGGGSTEISVFENGQRVASKSFNLGTIRILKGKIDKDMWKTISTWIKKNVELTANHKVFGTGGNINKAHKMLGAQYMEPLRLKKIEELKDQLEPLTVEQRVERFQLKPDRADVIVPAMEIYSFIMRELKCRQIHVPKIGLSDGIVFDLNEKHNNE
jgi:exopolyphosphatase/guanosine-5'-triphosphate,3'-diphosphate pyrophosphatase